MLILTRNIGQIIMINDDIMIQYLERRFGQIRLGITAPLEYAVHRKEVYDQRRLEREQNEY